jgi:undecaprenyl-diphosphatase
MPGAQTTTWRFTLASASDRLPIGLVGVLFEDVIKGPVLRSLTAVAVGLIAWSAVMVLAERRATQARGEADVTIRDGVLIGLAQCIALVPGVSRSGATISAGLLLGLDRVSATRMAFFLGIPALTAAGSPSCRRRSTASSRCRWSSARSCRSSSATPRSPGCCAWWPSRSIVFFVPYRVALGVVVLAVLAVT